MTSKRIQKRRNDIEEVNKLNKINKIKVSCYMACMGSTISNRTEQIKRHNSVSVNTEVDLLLRSCRNHFALS